MGVSAQPITLPFDPDTRGAARSVLKGALELRSRAFKALLTLLAIFLCLVPFANELFALVANPMMIEAMPEGSRPISEQVASPFMTPLKAAFWVALFVAMPFTLCHVWRLVDAWLPAKGRRVGLPFITARTGRCFGIACQDAPAFEGAADALGQPLHEGLQLLLTRGLNSPEHGWLSADEIRAVENVQIER